MNKIKHRSGNRWDRNLDLFFSASKGIKSHKHWNDVNDCCWLKCATSPAQSEGLQQLNHLFSLSGIHHRGYHNHWLSAHMWVLQIDWLGECYVIFPFGFPFIFSQFVVPASSNTSRGAIFVPLAQLNLSQCQICVLIGFSRRWFINLSLASINLRVRGWRNSMGEPWVNCLPVGDDSVA